MAKTDLTTDTQIKKAIKDTIKTAKTISYPIAGYKGLEIRIRAQKDSQDVTADFRHRYTHPVTGKRPYMTLGQYPALSLAEARQYHSDNMQLLAKSVDPIEHRDSLKQKDITDRQNTLNYFINEWQEIQNSKSLSQSTIKSNKIIIKVIQQKLGHMKVTDISPSIVIRFIKDIQKKHTYKGLTVKTILKSILQIAKAHMIIEYNPASDLGGTLIKHKVKHRPSLTQPKEFAELLKDIDQLDDTSLSQLYNKSILQLLALTFVRIGDVSAMRWADIDLNAKQWILKPQKGQGRGDMVDSVVIPLAPQAIAILERVKSLTGGYDYVFYNTRRKKVQYHNAQEVNKLLNSPAMNNGKGYQDIHSPHGFRASAKTMLMERLGYDELITEIQLGHAMLNKYGKAYSRFDFSDSRTQMMNDWANYLDNIKAGNFDNLIRVSFKQQTQKHG
ncbi:tyrosine-type recombinase/integrase [Psychrobacter alimentarius]|uniref:tyrosine-type recombinase/integrase n=1 Tax=Psychrobacter alimentarius TaxID=261164 RepID=UPI003FD4132C